MKTIDAGLLALQQLPKRKPSAQILVRDRRLRFASIGGATNPWGITNDAAQVGGEDYTYGDQATFNNGAVMRVWGKDGVLKMNVVPVASVSTLSAWASWIDVGNKGGSISARDYTIPGLVAEVDAMVMFYVDEVGDRVFWSSLPNSSSTEWADSIDTSVVYLGSVRLCPTSRNECFVFQYRSDVTGPAGTYNKYLNVTRLYYASGSWHEDICPWQLRDSTASLATETGHDFATFAGAVKVSTGLGGRHRSHLFFTDGTQGVAWQMTVLENGDWSHPNKLLPDDDTGQFVISHVSNIQDTIWVTGQVTRTISNAAYPLKFDVFMNWHEGRVISIDRDSFASATPLRGKLLLSGTKAIYAGIYTILLSDSTHLIDPVGDPSAKKVDITSDLVGFKADFPSSGTAPSGQLSLANGSDQYFVAGTKTTLVKPGADVEIWAGYGTAIKTCLLAGSVDALSRSLTDGGRTASLSLRESAFKALKDFNSLFYYEFLSQQKHFDPCDNMSGLIPANAGIYTSKSKNLVSNGGFELIVGTEGGIFIPPWSKFTTGSAVGTMEPASDEKYQGDYSVKLTKTAGGTSDQLGIQTGGIPVDANQTYSFTVHTLVLSIAGGSKHVKVKAVHNTTAESAEDIIVDVTDGWLATTLTLTPTASGYVTFKVYFDSASTGVFYIDEVYIYKVAVGYLRYSSINEDHYLVSATPFATDEFDIQASFSLEGVSGARASWVGLIGHYSDTENMVALKVNLRATTNNVFLSCCKDGIWTNLTSFYSFAPTLTLKTQVRLIYSWGRFLVYVKNENVADWGNPLITYYWSQAGPPSSKPGQVGTFQRISNYRFHAYAVDSESEAILLRLNNDLNWSSFPSSGTVVIDGEQITYAGKTSGTDKLFDATFNTQGDVDNTPSIRDTAPDYPGDPTTRVVDYWNYGWRPDSLGDPHYVACPLAAEPADDAWVNYGVAWTTSQSPSVCWWIDDSVGEPSGQYDGGLPALANVVFHCDESGHSTGGRRPSPASLVPTGGEMHMVVAPCLKVTLRGANDTLAAPHADNATVSLYTDETILIHDFQYYDMAVDNSTEDLIRKVCDLVDVETEFNSLIDESPVSLDTGESLALSNDFWLNWADFDLTFTIDGFLPGSVAHVRFRDNGTTYYEIRIRNDLTPQVVSLYYGATELERFHLAEAFDVYGDLDVRLVVHADFFTVYLSNLCLGTVFHNATLASNTVNGISLRASGTDNVNFLNVHLPELYEWREGVRFGPFQDAMAGLNEVTRDRSIKLVSRGSRTLKASTFMAYDDDTLLRDDLGLLPALTVSDSDSINDQQVFSLLHITGADIIEMIDETLAREYGIISSSLSLPTVSLSQTYQIGQLIFQSIKENLEGRDITLAADLRMEIEDRFQIAYTSSGSARVVSKDLIVNSLSYSYEANETGITFDVQVGSRKMITGF